MSEQTHSDLLQLQQAENAVLALSDDDILNMLTMQEQIDLIDTIRRKTIYSDVENLDVHSIVEAITFDNCHQVAYYLANSPELSKAKGLYEELKYFADTGRFD